MFSTCLQNFVAWNHHLGPQRMHPQKHIPYYLLKKSKVTVRKNETWHSNKHFQYINLIYSETWFNLLHLIFFNQSKIFCLSISKNTIKLRDSWFFSFLLHLMCQKWPSLACTHPGLSQNKDEYFRLHWISHVSSLNTPKDMFDAINNTYEDDLENSTQACEGAMP